MASEIQVDFKSYQDKVTESLKNVTRSAQGVSSYDLGFHRSINESVSKSLTSQNQNLLRLTNKLLKAVASDTNIKAPVLRDVDDVDDKWRPIVDVVDDQLEKADANLDEFNGLIKPRSTSQPSTPEPQPQPQRARPYPQQSPYGMMKPQRLFERKVDNFQTSRWRPLLTTKPHAIVPLSESIGSEAAGYKHPYAQEIEQYKFPPPTYQQSVPIPFTRPEKTYPIWVDTEEAVHAMLLELKQATEIAVDLEHNNINSYVGMVCLMQISTRSKDWVVDTLKPWRENLQCLNEVFADPSILKVFHGATSDMIWLQRDLGLYVVGLFDTFHAASALNYPQKSLAFLLQKFANFAAQKQYQLADWRVRPLPAELLEYARSDTHYLLYVYDNMRNELVLSSTPENSLVDYVLENSKKESLQVYERHPYDRENGLGPDGWLKILLSKSAKVLDKPGFGVFRALHEWRDQKAREIDEGVPSIMSNVYMWNCAEVKPDTKFQLFNPRVIGRASKYITDNPDEVIDVIRRGKREGLEGPTVQEVIDRNADKISTFRHFKHVNPQAKPQEIQQSIAATMQKLVQNGEFSPSTPKAESESSATPTSAGEPLAMRAVTSGLWGQASLSPDVPILDTTSAQAALESLLPSTKSAAVSNDVTNGTSNVSSATSNANGSVDATRDVDEVNVSVRDTRGKKRSVDEVEDGDSEISMGNDATDSSHIDANHDDEDDLDQLTEQRQKKAVKQARKAAEKAARDAALADATPFDYTNAPSVLYATGSTTPSKEAQPVKILNPFAKALDTSTGARRNRYGKELGGKSHTFKS